MKEIKGKTADEMYGPMEMNKKKKHFPMLDISLNDLPEAGDWKPGKMYKLGLKVRMKSIRDDVEQKNGNASFEIRGIEVQKMNEKKAGRASRYEVD